MLVTEVYRKFCDEELEEEAGVVEVECFSCLFKWSNC
jgi:hypothetical protein